MKTFYLSIILLLLVLASSCSDDPIGPGNIVTFVIEGQGDPTSYTFGFRPSVNITLSSIIASLPSENFYDTLVNFNTAYVFSNDTNYTLESYTGVLQGQVWSFTFAGSTASNNSAFTNITNFQVP